MIKMMMHGCNGKMGRMITEIVKGDGNAVIAAGVDTYTGVQNDYPVFESIDKCDVDVDVVIDFSTAGAVRVRTAPCLQLRTDYLPNCISLLPDSVVHISSMLIGSL